MYCDVDSDGILVRENLGPPRQQVFEALAKILSDDTLKVYLHAACKPSFPFCMHRGLPLATWQTFAPTLPPLQCHRQSS